MSPSPLILALFVFAPALQDQEAVPIVGASPDAREARLHAIPPMPTAARRAELEAVLFDPAATKTARDAAYADYVAILEGGTALTHATQLASTLEFVLDPEFTGAPMLLRPSADGSALLVRATDAQHAAIDEVIAELEGETRVVDLQTTILSVKNADLDRILGGQSARVMTPMERDTAVASIESPSILSAPGVIFRVGSVASISTGEELPYVSNYEFTSFPGAAAEIADPTIATVFEGLELTVRAAPRKGSLRVKVDFKSTEVEQPIATETVKVRGTDAIIQRPKVKTIAASSVFELGGDASILLGARDDADQNSTLVVITASIREAGEK